jgi:hypothetical protein
MDSLVNYYSKEREIIYRFREGGGEERASLCRSRERGEKRKGGGGGGFLACPS